MTKLTAKQEKFVQSWYATGNKSEAYRQAYNCAKWKDSSVNQKASTLSSNVKVMSRYSELVEASQKRNNTTVDVLDAMAKEAFEIAKDDRSPAAMNQAVSVLAKLHGLNQPDKIDHGGDIVPVIVNAPDWLSDDTKPA